MTELNIEILLTPELERLTPVMSSQQAAQVQEAAWGFRIRSYTTHAHEYGVIPCIAAVVPVVVVVVLCYYRGISAVVPV